MITYLGEVSLGDLQPSLAGMSRSPSMLRNAVTPPAMLLASGELNIVRT